MARGRHSFSQGVRNFAESIPDKGNELKRGVALAFLKRVVPDTPVRDGYARNNWMVGLGSRQLGQREQPNKSGSVALSQGEQEIKKSAPLQPIHISNNTPYIGRLNRGSSTQAPAGFIEAAVAAAKAAYPSIVASVRKIKAKR